ncbi:MAG: EAL domain-containing protein, partial [Alcaligenaceae bacterium]|nr:EAL domain-containing protein [Alcaligenaceae bacterium]
CDLRAIDLGLNWVQENPGTLVLRLSLASMLLPEFLPEMKRILSREGLSAEDRGRFVLEVDAHGFVAYPQDLEAFCELASDLGVGVGVRRLAEQPAALLRLHTADIRYIKLGGDLISGLMDSPGATQLIAAITEVAIGQGVKIYAHDVPNAHTAALLQEYGALLPVEAVFNAPEDESTDDFVDN